MKRSKAYQDADAKIDHEALYSPVDAIDLEIGRASCRERV